MVKRNIRFSYPDRNESGLNINVINLKMSLEKI